MSWGYFREGRALWMDMFVEFYTIYTLVRLDIVDVTGNEIQFISDAPFVLHARVTSLCYEHNVPLPHR